MCVCVRERERERERERVCPNARACVWESVRGRGCVGMVDHLVSLVSLVRLVLMLRTHKRGCAGLV